MLDRASIFADPEIIDLLQKQFVPVAIDQFAQRRQKDEEGDFWRKIAGQGPRKDFNQTTQGLYIATAGGALLGFNNNRGPERIRKVLHQALEAYKKGIAEQAKPLVVEKADNRFLHHPPEGVRIIRVHAKVLGGHEPTDDKWKKIFNASISRDLLWITAEEERELAKTRVIPPSLARRLALFHLIDNTRGEPTFWKPEEIRQSTLTIDKKGGLLGRVHLSREDQSSGFEANLRGVVEFEDEKLTRFDLVAHGDYWGHGKYTSGAPEGRFPLGISFRLVDGTDSFDQITPQGAKSWWQNYLGGK